MGFLSGCLCWCSFTTFALWWSFWIFLLQVVLVNHLFLELLALFRISGIRVRSIILLSLICQLIEVEVFDGWYSGSWSITIDQITHSCSRNTSCWWWIERDPGMLVHIRCLILLGLLNNLDFAYLPPCVATTTAILRDRLLFCRPLDAWVSYCHSALSRQWMVYTEAGAVLSARGSCRSVFTVIKADRRHHTLHVPLGISEKETVLLAMLTVWLLFLARWYREKGTWMDSFQIRVVTSRFGKVVGHIAILHHLAIFAHFYKLSYSVTQYFVFIMLC